MYTFSKISSSHEEKTLWLLHGPSAYVDPQHMPACYSRRFWWCSPFYFSFIAHRRHCLKLDLSLKYSQHTQFIGHLHFWLPIFEHLLWEQHMVRRATGKPVLRKTWEKSSLTWQFLVACVWLTIDALRTWRTCSAWRLWSARLLHFKNWDSFNVPLLHEPLICILPSNYFASGAAAVTDSITLFTGS